MLVYRIVHKSFADTLFASGKAGRWNKEGDKVIYAAESIPLAFLENMIRRQGVGFNRDFKIMILEVPDELTIDLIDIKELEPNWRDANAYFSCQQMGHIWYVKGVTILLKAPSAVLPEAFNYVIHTGHQDFEKIKLLSVTDLLPDQRIEGILKNYKP